MDKKLLTLKQISSMYGIKLPTLYWWLRQKKFSYLKINKLIFVRESEFQEFLSQYEIEVDEYE